MFRKLFYIFRYLYRYAIFLTDYWKFYREAQKRPDQRFLWKDRYPCLFEKTKTAGFDRHYIFHTAWAARILATTRPQRHVDISSSLYFASIVSAFVPVEFYDFRPVTLNLDNALCGQANLLSLQFESNSIISLSCMHVVEHIGLGRYGDPLDVFGDIKAIQELKRVLAKGGHLLLVVPVGVPCVMFNAHRIYSYEQVMDYCNGFELIEFSLIPDREGGLLRRANPALVASQRYACGCFWFKKPDHGEP